MQRGQHVQKNAARSRGTYLDEFCAGLEEPSRVVDMLEDLHRAYHVVPSRLFDEFLGIGVAVSELRRPQAWINARVRGCNANIRFRGIDAQRACTQPCQALRDTRCSVVHAWIGTRPYFGEQSTATPDVEDIQSPESILPLFHAASCFLALVLARDLDQFFADVLYPGWVHAMEQCKLAMFVPPERRKTRKVCNFVCVDARRGLEQSYVL